MLSSSSISWSRTAFPEVKLMRYIFELLGRLARWSCKQMNKTQAEGSHKVYSHLYSMMLTSFTRVWNHLKQVIETSRSLCTALPKAWQRRCTKMSSSWTWTASKRRMRPAWQMYANMHALLCRLPITFHNGTASRNAQHRSTSKGPSR